MRADGAPLGGVREGAYGARAAASCQAPSLAPHSGAWHHLSSERRHTDITGSPSSVQGAWTRYVLQKTLLQMSKELLTGAEGAQWGGSKQT